jgi:hypothetical protein
MPKNTLSLISEMQKAPIVSHYVSLVVHTQQCTLLKLPVPNYFLLFIKSMGLMEKATTIEEQDKIFLDVILFVGGTFREPRK